MNRRVGLVCACLACVGTVAAGVGPAWGIGPILAGWPLNGGFDPSLSDIHPGSDATGTLAGIDTNRLRGSFDGVVAFEVYNQGDGGTTFTASLEPDSDPAYVPTGLAVGIPIGPREMVHTGPVAEISASLPSGIYNARVCVHNDLNPLDADEWVDYGFWIYDPPLLTHNTPGPVDPAVDPLVFIANAPAGPHAGALRAGVRILATTVAGPGFSATGMAVGTRVGPGQTAQGTAAFDLAGRTAGTHSGSLTVDLQMISMEFAYLNGALPMPSLRWDLVATVAPTASLTAELLAGESFRDARLGVRDATTAVDIVGGTAGGDRSVSLVLDPPRGGFGAGFDTSAGILGEAVSVSLGGSGDTYALQINVVDVGLDRGALEALRVLYYDAPADRWRDAIEVNANFEPDHLLPSASGGRFHPDVTFDQYLAAGGSLVPGHHGLWVSGAAPYEISAWAILDHNSVFGAGIIPEPATLALMALGALRALLRRRSR